MSKKEDNSCASSELLTSNAADAKKGKTFKAGFIVTLPIFMGYACCFSLQKSLSYVFGLTEGVSGDNLSKAYGVATSFVYFFNLIFRVFGHNIVFACLAPRDRVIVSLISMLISMTMLSIVSYSKAKQNIAWAFISYAFAGICEGSFGPNMLNVCNALGDTRLYVVIAMPCGVGTITIVGFALMGFGVPYQVFYILTSVCIIISIIIYVFTIYPATKSSGSRQSEFNLKDFCSELGKIGKWFPKIWKHSIIFIVDMLCLALFNPGCTLYSYQSRVTYRLFGFTISHDWFVLTYNIGSFLGDFLSRKVMDKKRIIDPIWYFILLVFAFIMNISLIPEIAPLAALQFSWANGSLYCQSTKLIGELFHENYHLTATSTWLFFGDIGSTIGANVVQPMRPLISSIKSLMF